VIVVAYNPLWKNDFAEIRTRLAHALHGIQVNIEHVGSTAITGLAAKPIIDIDVVYQEAPVFDMIKTGLENVGYCHHGDQGLAGREVFKRKGTPYDDVLDNKAHHLYVCMYDNLQLRRHILFRDYLQKHEVARNFYMNLKYEIAAEANGDRKQYADIKEVKAGSFINYIVQLSAWENEELSIDAWL
jgi:GrpB-like predicted nucleotidyltransferase (UPF0157 family)